jgi:hypothetical protein
MSDPGSSLRGLRAAVNFCLRQTKTQEGRHHLRAALREVEGAIQAEREWEGSQGSRHSTSGKESDTSTAARPPRRGRVY